MKVRVRVEIEGTHEEIKECIKDTSEKDFRSMSFYVLTENNCELTLENLNLDVSAEDATDVVDWVKKQK